MATFVNKPTANIKANLTGSSGYINIGGVHTGTDTTENAAAQINKVLAVVGKSVSADKMTRTITQEGDDD